MIFHLKVKRTSSTGEVVLSYGLHWVTSTEGNNLGVYGRGNSRLQNDIFPFEFV